MAIEHDLQTPFAAAVRAYGSQSETARRVKKSQASVYQLLKSEKPVWADKVIQIERETGVSRHELNPAVFPRDEAVAPPVSGSEVAR